MWRGPALVDVRARLFAQPEIARLSGLRLECTVERLAADLDAGAGADVIAELDAMVVEHPLNERIRELQMLALYRAGRQTDALAAYRDARRVLSREHGLDPGRRLRDLEAAILRHDVPAPAGIAAADVNGTDRRRVTCLYARLIAGQPAATDPEALRAQVGRYHELVRASCRRHGGTVAELRSDGALVVFGIPVVHEDDPLRAVRAALELRNAGGDLGDGLASAVGISTGVVVAPLDTPEAAIFGEPVTTADGLAHSRDQILIAASTRALVEHAAPGVHQPDESYRVDGPIDDTAAIRHRHDRPLVGRTRELNALGIAHTHVVETSVAGVITVIGEAGIGKSRLAAELATALPAETLLLQGRCPPYGEGTTYLPLREIVLQACAGRPWHSLAEELGLDPGVASTVAATVGLGTSPVGEDASWAFRQFIDALARIQPVVIVIDDAHWAEPGLLDLLSDVILRSDHQPVLMVWFARPEFPARGRAIEVKRLSPDESQLLLTEVAGDRLGSATRRQIADTAAGNPLFLEQLATYVDAGHATTELPPALQGLLAARLDQLEPLERAVLGYGSIQGAEFTVDSVHELAEGAAPADIERASNSLVRHRLLEGSGTLRFGHALIRQAAYESLTKATRARLHERYAGRLIRLADTLPDSDALIGFQLESAYRCLVEIRAERAGELATRARQALAAAARGAHQIGDLPGEIGFLERAIELEANPEAERAELLPALAAALSAAGSFERATTIADEAVRVAETLGPPRLRARAVVERERLRVYQHQATIDVPETIRIVDDALATLNMLGDDLGQSRAHYLRCELAWMDGGDIDRAYASAERMLACARRAGSGFETSEAAGYMTWGLALGPTPVPRALQRCTQLRDQFDGDRVAILEVDGLRALLLAMAGRFDEGRSEMARSRAGMAAIGLTQASAYMALFDGQLETMAGNAEAAELAVRDAGLITEETRDRWFQSTVRVDLANALIFRGQVEQAAAAVDAIDEIPAPNDPEWVIKRHTARALVAAHTGAFETAVSEADAATAAADATGMLLFRADAHHARAKTLRMAGNDSAAADAAREAIRLHHQKGNVATAAVISEFLVAVEA